MASAKGIFMQYMPAASLVDLSHLVEPFHTQQAAYLLLSAWSDFPAGSFHVLLCDIFSERSPRLVLAEKEGHYFLAPDNGILSLAFGPDLDPVWACWTLPAGGNFKDWLHQAGRMMATVSAHGPQALDLPRCQLRSLHRYGAPIVHEDSLECHVIHIDRFENVVINLTRDQFEAHAAGRGFRIRFMRDEELNRLSDNYFDMPEGEKLCRFNATGFLEISINRGKAASLFGFRLYQEHHLMYNTIKIIFT